MEVDGSDDSPDFNWASFRFHANFQGCIYILQVIGYMVNSVPSEQGGGVGCKK